MKDSLVSEEEIVKEYGNYSFPEDVKKELYLFLSKRASYLVNPTMDTRVEMKNAFEDIYLDTKLAFHLGIISEPKFHELTELLRAGVK